ncbi:aminoglycoside phosphotransferase family protein [Sphingomonas hylomeconis]|uniref:Aminoglycoside phosphotransferase family protein n=1 Tax=Sphingomonas hylomeconis TaxID=1395958 RepID=A0ABV7SVJ7_9SPHN|nr:aminoglycoside phosphotransferase family protein [Sphingomonas hylomeconis]
MIDHPAFADCRSILPLSGFSGALIALIRDDAGRQFVRKVAEQPGNSERLRRQATRQGDLERWLDGVARVPAIDRDGVADDCYWFDMSFAPGRDGVTFLFDASRAQQRAFITKVHGVVERLASLGVSDATVDVAAAAKHKIDEIKTRLGTADHATLDRLELHFRSAPTALPATVAHGDLTLENIIVAGDGSITLIDTIDSPFDHYWNDLAKLFQDLEGRWFQHRGKRLPIALSWDLRQQLFAAARAMDPGYASHHYLMLALVFARILPYAKSAADTAFVEHRLATFLDQHERSVER